MFPWLRATVAAGAFAIVATGLVAPPASAEGAAQRYLVQYAPGTDIAAAARSLRTQGIDVGRTFGHAVKAAVVTTTEARAEALEDSPRVESVEVDALVNVGDTQPSAPWGLDRLDQRALPLSTTFSATAAGLGVDAYVIDTGVDAAHLDLAGRVTNGWTAINDGVGSNDCDGHGTHVAGTVAGTTYGVAKAATVVPVRVLDCNGSGYMSSVVAGLDWMVARHVAGTPAVANLSLGGGISATVDAAIDRAVADGVTVAVSAGNDATDACSASPARAAAALTVAATDSNDRQASFSNVGRCVDLYAPGVSIVSAAAGTTTGTSSKSGTSMASPHVAGAAAVLLSREPALTPAQVAARLTADATSGVVAGATAGTPNRLLYLDPGATAPAPQTPPAPAPTQPEPAPTQPSPGVEPPVAAPQPAITAPQAASSIEAVARQRAARLSWVRGEDGGSPLTGQTVRVYRGTMRVGSFPVPSTVSAVRIIGLRPGRTYRFTVVETNLAGNSPESARSERVRPRR